MNLRENIRKILREQPESKKDILKSTLKQSGIDFTSKLMGGIDNIVNVLYDGDIMEFSEDTHTPIVYMSINGDAFYLHEVLVNRLGLKNSGYNPRGEKELGDFRYGIGYGIGYKFTARLYPTNLHDQPYYKVVGTSGDSGFGYSFITKRNTLGTKYRQQIFKQIIDRYNLEPYMKLKTFFKPI